MKIINVLLFVLCCSTIIFSQKTAEEQAIFDEGVKMYKSEMASWYGTDIFMENHKSLHTKASGYFSYVEEDQTKCIFFDREEIPNAVITISFDSTFNINTALVDTTLRALNKRELSLHTIRQKAYQELRTDTMFVYYDNTNFNLIPLVEGDSKKVYVLTGPKVNGVVVLGNDYLLTFDKEDNLIEKKVLHNNIIPIEYGQEGMEAISSIHTHNETTGDLITSTDICTLMLYSKYAGWESHIVIGKNRVTLWSCERNDLFTMTKEAFEKIYEDQEEKEDKN